MRILITTANRCPQGILWAPHFRDDGSCRCDVPQDQDAADPELDRHPGTPRLSTHGRPPWTRPQRR